MKVSFLPFYHCKDRWILQRTGKNAGPPRRPESEWAACCGLGMEAALGWAPGGPCWGAVAPAVGPGWSGRCWSWWRGAVEAREALHLWHPMHFWTTCRWSGWVFFVLLLPGCFFSTCAPLLRYVTFYVGVCVISETHFVFLPSVLPCVYTRQLLVSGPWKALSSEGSTKLCYCSI